MSSDIAQAALFLGGAPGIILRNSPFGENWPIAMFRTPSFVMIG